MSLRQDVAYGARILRRSPAFTVTAVLSLALGIAANAAIFSLADAFLLRGRPGIAGADRLVDVGRSQDGSGFDNMSYPDYVDYRDRNTVFSGLAGHVMFPHAVGLGTDDGAERVYATAVSGSYFDVLGVRMALGRGFVLDEDRPGGASGAVVLSHGLWRERFRQDPGVIGRILHVNGRPFTIVGVAPEGFTGLVFASSDLWIPLTAYPETTGRDRALLSDRGAVWMQAVGRLKPGVALAQARADMTTIGRDLERAYPREDGGRGAALSVSHRVPAPVRPMATGFVGLLFALVGLVLAIACANVAGMLLARGVTRAREIAVRLAVGAGRARIVRQLVTESVVLAVIGGAGGVLGALAMIRALRGVMPVLPLPIAVEPALDGRVVAFSLVLALFTGIAFGVVPALQAARVDLVSALKSDASGRGPRRIRLRQLFVMGQVVMSMLLVVCALLFARSLAHAGRIDPGFVAEGVDVIDLDLRLAGYSAPASVPFVDEVLEGVRRLPGVRAAAFTRVVPLTGSGHGRGGLRVPGRPEEQGALSADWSVVTPGYFEAMRIGLRTGRDFTAADRGGAPQVAIVNETLAREAWPGQDPIGRVLIQEEGPTPADVRELHVVGVARDGKYRSLGESPRGFIWVAEAQQPDRHLYLAVRGDGTASAIPAVRDLLRRMNPHLPLISAAPLSEVTAVGLLPQRLAAWVAGSLGLVGLLLASIGVYGITAYGVQQRRREIGLRVAVGAAPADVLRLVIGGALRLAGTGALIGLLGAAAVTRLVVSLLYGIRPLDPASFAIAIGLFATLALVASGLPAWRAARGNPVDALRAE